MRLCILSGRQFEDTHKKLILEKNRTNVTDETVHMLGQAISGDI